jgi:comEA protein
MLLLTPPERKALIFIGILILAGSILRFYKVNSIEDVIPNKVQPRIIQEDSNNQIINVNKASEAQLQKLPGIGPKIASEIVSYRSKFGEFSTLNDLKKVKGIGDKKVEGFSKYIAF